MKQIIYGIIALLCISCGGTAFQSKWASEISPAVYTARFETTKGNFDVEVNRKWSPKAADRFYQLVVHHYFDNAVFYRVVPDFVAQFGSSDTVQVEGWSKLKIPDEDVLHSNKKGSISFARDGKETRGTDLYINLKDNLKLDTITYNGVKGFPSFGDVIKGSDVVEALYSGYSEKTMEQLDTMYKRPASFFTKFPKLDFIKKAYIIK